MSPIVWGPKGSHDLQRKDLPSTPDQEPQLAPWNLAGDWVLFDLIGSLTPRKISFGCMRPHIYIPRKCTMATPHSRIRGRQWPHWASRVHWHPLHPPGYVPNHNDHKRKALFRQLEHMHRYSSHCCIFTAPFIRILGSALGKSVASIGAWWVFNMNIKWLCYRNGWVDWCWHLDE